MQCKFHYSKTWYLHVVFIYKETGWSIITGQIYLKIAFDRARFSLILMCFYLISVCYLCGKQPSHPNQWVVFWWETQSMSKYWGLLWSTRDTPDYNPLCYQKLEDNDLYKGILIETVSIYSLHEQFRKAWIDHEHLYMYTCTCQYINSKCFVAHTLAFMKPWISPSFQWYQQVWYTNVQQNC